MSSCDATLPASFSLVLCLYGVMKFSALSIILRTVCCLVVVRLLSIISLNQHDYISSPWAYTGYGDQTMQSAVFWNYWFSSSLQVLGCSSQQFKLHIIMWRFECVSVFTGQAGDTDFHVRVMKSVPVSGKKVVPLVHMKIKRTSQRNAWRGRARELLNKMAGDVWKAKSSHTLTIFLNYLWRSPRDKMSNIWQRPPQEVAAAICKKPIGRCARIQQSDKEKSICQYIFWSSYSRCW